MVHSLWKYSTLRSSEHLYQQQENQHYSIELCCVCVTVTVCVQVVTNEMTLMVTLQCQSAAIFWAWLHPRSVDRIIMWWSPVLHC